MRGDDNEAKVDHKEGADDDQHHKVDPVPEGVSILKFLVLKISEVLLLNIVSAIWPCQTSNLYKVHDISPPLERDDEEDGDPGEANIVEGDRPIERVGRACCALGVVLVPVHAAVLILCLLRVEGAFLKIKFLPPQSKNFPQHQGQPFRIILEESFWCSLFTVHLDILSLFLFLMI